MFTVVMPSFLGDYPTAAGNRPEKLRRAIDSCLRQTFQDFELFIVCDGCNETWDIVHKIYRDAINTGVIRISMIHKQPLWSGGPRNFGIHHARGKYIVYLDTDDCFGEDHLGIIASQLLPSDLWVYFNDHVARKTKGGVHGYETVERIVDIEKKNQNGTSNICHLQNLQLFWEDSTYAHDWKFVSKLRKLPSRQINTPQYYVMHIPNEVDL